MTSDVITSINNLGKLEVVIDRNGSSDFYGFDYAMLSDRVGDETFDVPEPSTLAIFALGMIGLASRRFKKQS